MRGWILLLAVIPLQAACSEDLSESERAAQDAQTVEMVRNANDQAPPLREVVPAAILYPDIEQHDLFGQACAYAPGTSLGARVIAREADAYMKIEGEMMRFAADPGSRELPARSRTLYNARAYSLRLEIEGDGQPAETDNTAVTSETGERGETVEMDGVSETSAQSELYAGTIWLRDRWGRVVYQGTGTVSCGV